MTRMTELNTVVISYDRQESSVQN